MGNANIGVAFKKFTGILACFVLQPEMKENVLKYKHLGPML
jgi:hypothetical protein